MCVIVVFVVSWDGNVATNSALYNLFALDTLLTAELQFTAYELRFGMYSATLELTTL
jgi:hypothetical protein